MKHKKQVRHATARGIWDHRCGKKEGDNPYNRTDLYNAWQHGFQIAGAHNVESPAARGRNDKNKGFDGNH